MIYKPALLMLIALVAFPALCLAEVPRNIHISWEEDPTTGITISWQTSSPTGSMVEFGESLVYGSTASADEGRYHNVKLAGLRPNTTYHYRCGNGQDWSPDHVFSTAPEGDRFTFLVVGDTHTDLPGEWPSVAARMAQTKGAFIIHTGDLVTYGRDPDAWDTFFGLDGQSYWLRPLMPAMGNHEEHAQIYFDQFALPDAEQWYSFDYCNTHFVSLSTYTELTGPQLEWLREDLQGTDATWKFVYFHHPVGSRLPFHKGTIEETWIPLFDEYHVDFVFQGHAHIYSIYCKSCTYLRISSINPACMHSISHSPPSIFPLCKTWLATEAVLLSRTRRPSPSCIGPEL